MFGEKFWPQFISIFIGIIIYKVLTGLLGDIALWWKQQMMEFLSMGFIFIVSLAVGDKFFSQGVFYYPDEEDTSTEISS